MVGFVLFFVALLGFPCVLVLFLCFVALIRLQLFSPFMLPTPVVCCARLEIKKRSKKLPIYLSPLRLNFLRSPRPAGLRSCDTGALGKKIVWLLVSSAHSVGVFTDCFSFWIFLFALFECFCLVVPFLVHGLDLPLVSRIPHLPQDQLQFGIPRGTR